MKKVKKLDRNDFSPVFPTIIQQFHTDEDGNSVITLVEDDISASLKSKGRFQDWSINSLTKAGIDPNFPIHTGFVSRAEGNSQLVSAVSEVNSVLDKLGESKVEESKVEESKVQ